MKIILSGGGTIGSVTPLLAIAQKMPEADIIFIGTKDGPEKKLIESKNIKFQSIIAGKFRRYWDIRNIIDIFKLKIACWQSLFKLIKEKPNVQVSAGGYVSVPLIWMGWLLRIPSIVHSQDIETGLAIKLMKPFAKKITKVFPDTELDAEIVGNPARSLEITTNIFKLKQDKPVILVTGGGTGAMAINNLVSQDLLNIAQVIHITGKQKMYNNINHPDYYQFEFLDEAMSEAMHKADLVISRAGLGTLTELSILGKPTVLIPMPKSHQQQNAKYFQEHNAVIVLDQLELTLEKLNQEVQNLLSNKTKLETLSQNIKQIIQPDAATKLVKIIQNF